MTSTTGTTPPDGTHRGRRTILASRPLMGWRTIDLLTGAFLGVALGVVFFGWSALSKPLGAAIGAGYPPAQGLLLGGWLLGGIVGGLVVRRPGAALFVEVVAALVEALLGSHFGVGAVISGVCQGVGAEIAFALLGYRRFGLVAAVLAGAFSVPLEMIYERNTYWSMWGADYYVVYCLLCLVSGALVAGPLGSVLTRALASAGALRAFPPGQEEAERRLGR